MKNCNIGICEAVSIGAFCIEDACPNWKVETEEPEEKQILIDILKSKYNSGYAKGDVENLLDEVDEMVCDAMDLIKNNEYGKAWDKLLNIRVELGEE